jgi:hypothetical protein
MLGISGVKELSYHNCQNFAGAVRDTLSGGRGERGLLTFQNRSRI